MNASGGTSGIGPRASGGEASPGSLARLIVLLATVPTYWLLMMAVHEAGHVAHAIVSGGRVVRVVLHPLQFSRTDVSPNPAPLFVVCGGPLWGVVGPLMVWIIWERMRWPASLWWRGFAGFCAIANGLYLAAGVFLPAGDTEDLLRLGVERWVLAAMGVPVLAMGLWMAHRMGPKFGLARMAEPEARRVAVRSAVTLALVAGLMLGLSRWLASVPA